VLAKLNLDLIIDVGREDLRGRPYEFACVACGWQDCTRTASPPPFAPPLRPKWSGGYRLVWLPDVWAIVHQRVPVGASAQLDCNQSVVLKCRA
jgi:hypothetical protein